MGHGVIKKIQTKDDNQGGQLYVLKIAPCMEGMYDTRHHSRKHHHSNSSGSDIDWEYTDDFIFAPNTYGQITKPLTKSMQYLPRMITTNFFVFYDIITNCNPKF